MTGPDVTRVDVHQHFLPPVYVDALSRRGLTTVGSVPFPSWDVDGMLTRMDDLRIDRAVLSISAPGVHFAGVDAARDLARACNEAAAEVGRRHPGRVGSFASLPLPDIDAALEELAYALDVLHADGVVLLTNYDGVYLSDVRFRPLWDELDRRGVVVFVHPAVPPGAAELDMILQPPLLEFTFDTTRLVGDLVASGLPVTHPSVRVVLAHLGGTVPFLAWRLSMLQDTRHPAGQQFRQFDVGVEESLRWFWYETATAGPQSIRAAVETVGADRLLFGSDVPFVPPTFLERTRFAVEQTNVLPPEVRRAIDGDTAARLFGGRGE